MEQARSKRRLQHVEEIVRGSAFFRRFVERCRERGIDRIVAFGLGNVAESPISLHQAAFCARLGVVLSASSVTAYDPIFTEAHWEVLGGLGIDKEPTFPHHFVDGTHTLVFMPHCDRPVNEAMLQCIEQRRDHMCLVYANRNMTESDAWTVNYLNPDLYDRPDVFNDCCFYRLTSDDDSKDDSIYYL